jgi:hypothetical protein
VRQANAEPDYVRTREEAKVTVAKGTYCPRYSHETEETRENRTVGGSIFYTRCVWPYLAGYETCCHSAEVMMISTFVLLVPTYVNRFRCICVLAMCICVLGRCICVLGMCVCVLGMCISVLGMCICVLGRCAENCPAVFRRVRRIAKNDCWLLHVCPPARMEELGCHWTDFD